ncbi:cadherin-like beta sandwich domain-containing protein [Candidatus Daviesbacteria bacterium]|nr:cadherin-like beta sandwich domain-containing protein [Candidatus Daviesbacteria bacterium]
MHRYYRPRSIKRLQRNSTRKLILSLILGFGLLYFIFTWGLPALLDGLSFFNQFKTTTKKEVINDTVLPPPVLNIPFEATNTATIKISGYTKPNSKVEVYFDDELKETLESDSEGRFQTNFIDLALGTNNIYGITVSEDGGKSLPSKNIKLIYNNEQPKLEILEPSDQQLIKGGDKKVKVSGKTEPNNAVTINGIFTVVNSDGNFSYTVSLNDGDNTITIVSTNEVGNKTEVQKAVKYEPES